MQDNNVVETQNQVNTRTILANPFISTPMAFTVTNDANGIRVAAPLYSKVSADRVMTGSIVTNPSAVGASAVVIPVTGVVKDGNTARPTQRLWIQTQSPSAPMLNKTLDFYIPDASNNNLGSPLSNMILRITNGLLLPTEQPSANTVEIPLNVGPESTTMGVIDESQLADILAMQAAGGFFGTFLDVAQKVAPVIAKSGYEIYKELSSDTEQNNVIDDDIAGLLGVLGSIAKVAVPIAGTLLSAL